MQVCPQCSAELKAGDPAGLCPACLLAGAGFTSSEPGTQTATLHMPEPADGDSFGPYRILRLLGEGGMGTVYLAEQTEPIRRRVALKVVKLGMDTNQVLARFNHERRSLAFMEHSNIARILDAGASLRGRPFFVMEYIEGASITAYCDRHQLTTAQRLELFLPVCRAVQHAHNKGVIHRDIKPSNVLVTVEDGKPVPKVIDFGIARAIDAGDAGNTFSTQFGQMVGTPEYASPEQADVVAGEIGAATDVYSLGVLLYEMLIGAVPFDGALLRKAGFAEMLRIIREEEAPSLAQRFSSLGPDTAEIAARRGTDTVTLRKLLDGDLNWITMKALEKACDRRYASVSDLAADVQKHMENRPVLASPPGRLYRTRKFLRRHRLAALGAAAGLMFLLLSGVTFWALSHRDAASRPKLTGKDTIVLADFDNKTGDPVFDDTLRQGLFVELQQSPFLSLISDRQVQQTLALMGQPKEARLTPEIAQQVCERTGSAAILEGSIARLGSQYVLGLRAKNCNSGNVLDQEQVQAARREDVLNSLSQIGRKFRTRVGESLATVQQHSTPLEEATTPSLEALKAYSTGLKLTYSLEYAMAIPFFQRAVQIDNKFAMAYSFLGFSYGGIGDSVLSAESTTRAWQLRDRASDRERFFIDFTYHRQVTGNLEKAFQTLGLWAQTYPRGAEPATQNLTPQNLMAGLSGAGTGRFERAIEEGQKSIAANPDFGIAYVNLARNYFHADRFGEAGNTLQGASARKLESPQFLVFRYNIAVLKGDDQQMNQVVAMAKGRRGAEHWVANSEALALAHSGQLRKARRVSNRAVDLALQEGQSETAATYQAVAAVWEALYGNAAAAKRIAMAALALSNGRDVEYAAALALAFAGDRSRSEALAGDLDKRFPEDTFARFTYVPVLRALSAFHQGRTAESLERLQVTLRYELAVNGLDFNLYLGGLHSAYVRGEAFVAAHQYAEAIAELQKILDHRGIVGVDPIGALAHLQLGRVFAFSGDKTKAKAAYQDFLALWKNADPDIPLLRQAKAEFARL
jgi:serine/threonine protein kinase/tetratricopeptide (TPR) repeat protein